MDFTDVKIWESDEKGFFIWSATNGNKCYLHEYIEFLQKELEAVKADLQLAKDWISEFEKHPERIERR